MSDAAQDLRRYITKIRDDRDRSRARTDRLTTLLADAEALLEATIDAGRSPEYVTDDDRKSSAASALSADDAPRSVRAGPPSRAGMLHAGSLPERIYAVLSTEPVRVFPVRALAEAVYGRRVVSSELESTRKSAQRLVARGKAAGSSTDGFALRRESD